MYREGIGHSEIQYTGGFFDNSMRNERDELKALGITIESQTANEIQSLGIGETVRTVVTITKEMFVNSRTFIEAIGKLSSLFKKKGDGVEISLGDIGDVDFNLASLRRLFSIERIPEWEEGIERTIALDPAIDSFITRFSELFQSGQVMNMFRALIYSHESGLSIEANNLQMKTSSHDIREQTAQSLEEQLQQEGIKIANEKTQTFALGGAIGTITIAKGVLTSIDACIRIFGFIKRYIRIKNGHFNIQIEDQSIELTREGIEDFVNNFRSRPRFEAKLKSASEITNSAGYNAMKGRLTAEGQKKLLVQLIARELGIEEQELFEIFSQSNE